MSIRRAIDELAAAPRNREWVSIGCDIAVNQPGFADAVAQPGRGSRSMGDFYSIASVASRVVDGDIGLVRIAVGSEPSADRERGANAAALAHLPRPFSADVYQDQKQGPDGRVAWSEDIFLSVWGEDDWTKCAVVPAGEAPLEIGSVHGGQIFLHLLQRRAVARWAYGYDVIYLFVAFRELGGSIPYQSRKAGALPETLTPDEPARDPAPAQLVLWGDDDG